MIALTDSLGPVLNSHAATLFFIDINLAAGAMLGCLLVALVAGCVLVAIELTSEANEARRASAANRAAEAARGRMSKPPFCNWKLEDGNKYCVFLSHFKVEAGSARCAAKPCEATPSLRSRERIARGPLAPQGTLAISATSSSA